MVGRKQPRPATPAVEDNGSEENAKGFQGSEGLVGETCETVEEKVIGSSDLQQENKKMKKVYVRRGGKGNKGLGPRNKKETDVAEEEGGDVEKNEEGVENGKEGEFDEKTEVGFVEEEKNDCKMKGGKSRNGKGLKKVNKLGKQDVDNKEEEGDGEDDEKLGDKGRKKVKFVEDEEENGKDDVDEETKAAICERPRRNMTRKNYSEFVDGVYEDLDEEKPVRKRSRESNQNDDLHNFNGKEDSSKGKKKVDKENEEEETKETGEGEGRWLRNQQFSDKTKQNSKTKESQMCHQCQRNDNGRVVRCMNCERKR